MTPRKSTTARTTTKRLRTKRVATKIAATPARTPVRRGSAVASADVEAQLTTIERGKGEGELDLGRGVRLHVSSLAKVYFPEANVTKGALMRYYTRVSPHLLPEIEGR